MISAVKAFLVVLAITRSVGGLCWITDKVLTALFPGGRDVV
jgi:preprotein translocase subunit SecE